MRVGARVRIRVRNQVSGACWSSRAMREVLKRMTPRMRGSKYACST